MRSLLIAGCGDLGIRLARRLDPDQWRICGLRRRPERLPEGIEAFGADLSSPRSLAGLEKEWDAVVYQATPGARDEDAYRRTYLEGPETLFAHVSTRRHVFVSSTAVYGQDDSGWVDETSPTEPTAFNGRILVEAEHRMRSVAPESVAVRFSGIYGPGREYLIRSLRQGSARCRREPPQWTNRIHANDCVGVLAHVLELQRPAPLYCATDHCPAPRCEVLEWLAERIGAPPPRELEPESGGGQGKRVANGRLLASGYAFQYPDYRTGYGTLVE
ncbi:MAG: SDR family oxidoreductase [Wenzhouxiangella sp.]